MTDAPRPGFSVTSTQLLRTGNAGVNSEQPVCVDEETMQVTTGPALPGRWLLGLSVQRQGLIAQGAQQITAVAEQQADGKAYLGNILGAGSTVEDFQQIAGSADALLGAGVEIGE